MPKLSIGETEALLGLPASTLRHWERVLPLLDPVKDPFGRRHYGEAELRLLFRIRHLSQRRGLGLREAQERILEELASPLADTRSRIAELRGVFVGLWAECREAGRRLETAAAGKGGAAGRKSDGPDD